VETVAGTAKKVRILIPSSFYSHIPAYEDVTECFETSEYKLQTLGNYPKESIQNKAKA
jgi:hypothetical protein